MRSKPAMARRMAKRVASRMFRESISAASADPTPMPTAVSHIDAIQPLALNFGKLLGIVDASKSTTERQDDRGGHDRPG